jgi:hypothetical protein
MSRCLPAGGLRIRREGIGEEDSTAVELLRHVATRTDLEVLPDLLTDPDPQVRALGHPLLRELVGFTDPPRRRRATPDRPGRHPHDDLPDHLQELRDLLIEWKTDSDPDDTAPRQHPYAATINPLPARVDRLLSPIPRRLPRASVAALHTAVACAWPTA